MKKTTATIAAVLLTLTGAASAFADTASLTMKGQKTGLIRGDLTQKGREGQIEVTHFEYGATSPLSPSTGQSTGRRQWETIKIYKPVDRASPQIFNSFVTNENITTFDLIVWRPGPAGVDRQFYDIKLVNAAIVSDRVLGPNDKDEATGAARGYSVEEFTLVFQKISVTYVDGGVSAQDDWTHSGV